MPINKRNRTILVKKSSPTQSSSTVHQAEDKYHSYSCSHCSKLFSSPSHLSRHILTHTGEKPCLCSECGQQFSQISSLERHQRTKHEKVKQFNSFTNRLYQCTLCHEYFSLKHNLKMHERKLHQIQTSFFCHLCSAYFTCNSSLQKHRNFRHRAPIKTQQSTISDDIAITGTNHLSDNWTIMQNDDQLNPTAETFDSPAASVSDPLTEEQSSVFSTELSSVNSNNLLNSNTTNTQSVNITKSTSLNNRRKHSCQQQTVHYQILKCNEIN